MDGIRIEKQSFFIGWSFCLQVGWLVACCMVGWLVVVRRLVGHLVGWLIGWLVGRFVGELDVGWSLFSLFLLRFPQRRLNTVSFLSPRKWRLKRLLRPQNTHGGLRQRSRVCCCDLSWVEPLVLWLRCVA